MTINWTQLYLDTHQFNEGAIAIASSFVGNVLAIAATTKPEYAESKQIIGYVFQDSGVARKGYALYSGKDILLLALPETSGLTFFPTNYLSDSYTLDISYASVGNILESNTAPIPDLILGLPVKVANLEGNTENIVASIEALTASDIDQSSRLAALEGTTSSPTWESVTGKPNYFQPAIHSHAISHVSGLSDELYAVNADVTSLASRVNTLESATPPESGSISTVSLVANSTLESNRRYLAIVSDLVCALPSTPNIGTVIEIQTDNFDLKITHGNALASILNNSVYTSVGIDNGIVIKPFSYIKLMYLGLDLWVSQVRSRAVNNFTPLSQESTASKKTYTATAPISSYGATIEKMYDGVKTVGGITNGYLSDVTTGNILITLSESIIIDEIKVWNGQGNVGAGGSSGYRLNDMIVYTGHTTSGENLGTYTFSDVTASEQIKTITPNAIPSNTFLLRVNSITPNVIGIVELEIWGKSASGGEVIVA